MYREYKNFELFILYFILATKYAYATLAPHTITLRVSYGESSGNIKVCGSNHVL